MNNKDPLEEIVNHPFYKKAKEDQERFSEYFKDPSQSIKKRLIDHRDLRSTALWYLSEEQSIAFSKMMFTEEADPSSNTSKEKRLIDRLFGNQKLKRLFPRQGVHIYDWGTGNGQKAMHLIKALDPLDVVYFPWDGSPNMTAIAIANLLRDRTTTFSPDVSPMFHVQDIPLSKEKMIAAFEEKKRQLKEIGDRLGTILCSDDFNSYLEPLVSQWAILPYHQQEQAVFRFNDFWHNPSPLLGQGGIPHFDMGVHMQQMEKILSAHWNIYAVGALTKQITNALTVGRHGGRSRRGVDVHTIDLLDEGIERLTQTDSPYKHLDLLHMYRFHKKFAPTLYKQADYNVRYFEWTVKKKEKPIKVYHAFYRVAADLYNFPLLTLPPGHSPFKIKQGFEEGETIFEGWMPVQRPPHESRAVLISPGLVGDITTNYEINAFEVQSYLGSIVPGQRLVAFLGQTLGNFEQEKRYEALRNLNEQMEYKDYVLIGVELAPPQEDTASIKKMEAAYRQGDFFIKKSLEPLGIDAECIGNLDARYNRETQDLELSLPVQQKFRVRKGLSWTTFKPGEDLPVGISHKFTIDELETLIKETGFYPLAKEIHTDQYQDYALLLAMKKGDVA